MCHNWRTDSSMVFKLAANISHRKCNKILMHNITHNTDSKAKTSISAYCHTYTSSHCWIFQRFSDITKHKQLPMNDGVPMQIVQSQSNLSGIHNRHVFIKTAIHRQQTLHVTTNQVLHHLQWKQIQIKTYKVPVTMKSATGAVQMQIIMKIMVWNNDEIIMKLS